jgi:CubicO group peptidase (beta-lactamase class C family)
MKKATSKRSCARVLPLATLLGATWAFIPAATGQPAASTNKIIPVIQTNELISLIEHEARAQAFSGVVLVSLGDSVLFTKAAGFADRERDVLNAPETRFNIASVGKLFTRIVILQLVQEGRIGLDDKLTRFFPGFRQPLADRITIRHLLDHRSGLGDVYLSKEYQRPENYSSADNVVAIIAAERPAFTPGTEERYSNSGYYLLGAIIAKVTGKVFPAAVKERILDRLGMSDTGFAATGEAVTNYAVPYAKKGTKIMKLQIATVGEPPSGAGSEYSTAADLFKIYASIIKDNALLSEESKALLFNHFQPGNWHEILHSGKITGYLGGDTRGWSAKLTFMFYRNSPCAVVVLANFDDMAHPLDLKLRHVIGKIS